MARRSFIPLLATSFLSVLNDNYLKTLASFVIVGALADSSLKTVCMGVVAAALVAPFVLFSPLADRLTALMSKCRIVRAAKGAEIPIVLLAALGFAFGCPALVIAGVLLMGVQSALMSPAKYALVRDIGGYGRISVGMGFMEGTAFLAMLLGTVAASWSVDALQPGVRNVILVAVAVAGLAVSFALRADEEPNRALHAVNPVRYLRRAHRMAHGVPGLQAVILELSVFWFAAAMLQMGLLVYGTDVLALDATHTGFILALAAVGIVTGQVLAGFVDRRHPLLAANLPTGWLAAALFAVLYFCAPPPRVFAVLVALVAFDLGFFKLPLDAEIQKTVKGPRLNAMLAYFNQVSFLFMMFSSVIYMALGALFGPRAFLLLLAVTFLIAPIVFLFHNRRALAEIGRWVLLRRYDVRLTGFETVDDPRKTCLVLPNHVAMADPMLLFAHLGGVRIAPLCDELFFDNPIAAAFLRVFEAVKVPDLRRHRTTEGVRVARGLQDVVTAALSSGRGVLFYPSGHLSTEPREDLGTRQLAYNVCATLPPDVTVVGVRTSGLWGSIWSRAGRTRSPDFGPTLARSVLLWLGCLVTHRRRRVDILFEDITSRVREWSVLPRADFNRRLEAWYNAAESVPA